VTIPDAVKIQFLPPEDEHSNVRNISRYLMQYVYYKIKELCFKLVIKTSAYYDAPSEKHQIIPDMSYCIIYLLLQPLQPYMGLGLLHQIISDFSIFNDLDPDSQFQLL
jgi:hypothetical protein